MPTILCFGDSNTWGAIPGDHRRYGVTERWPALLAASLPASYQLIEEGQPGRTTIHNDPFEGEKNGLRYLKPCLESMLPDLVLILLGTNDLKHRFGLSAYDIAQGVSRLVDETLKFQSLAQPRSPKVLLMCPPAIYEVGSLANMFAGGEVKSLALTQHYAQCAADLGCAFFDVGSVVTSCENEGIHWQVEQHRLLAEALTGQVQSILSSA